MLIKANQISKVELGLAALLFVLFLYYFIPSVNHEVRQQDEFDGNFTSRHLIIQSGDFFEVNPEKIVYGTMNGLPRANFVRFTEPVALLMYLFGSLNGYAIAFLLMRVIAFLGIYLFGRDFLNISNFNKSVLVLIGLCFACLPFNTSYGLSIAGIPIAFWAFFNLVSRKNIPVSFLTLFLFAVSSNFVLVGFHICFVLGLMALWYSSHKKKIQWLLFSAVLMLGFTYILTEYMMFYMHLFSHDYQSSRQAFEKELGLNIKGVIGVTIFNLFTGEYNTANYFGYLFIPFLILLIYQFIKDKVNEINKLGIFVFSLLIMCALLSTIFDWNKMGPFFEMFSFAKVFNLKRFASLIPGLFFLTITFALVTFNNGTSLLRKLSSIVVLLLFFVLIWRGNISRNRSSFDCKGVEINGDTPHTFEAFFNEPMYRSIKKEIGSDTIYNVVSFGVLPTKCKYVGLNVLDDYQGDYPLAYKQAFRKVIAKEIDKSTELKAVFDDWGSKCYLYSANTINNNLKSKNGFPLEPQLDIDAEQLKQMKCKYILSSILIGNSNQLHLEFKKVFVSNINFETIFLYKLL